MSYSHGGHMMNCIHSGHHPPTDSNFAMTNEIPSCSSSFMSPRRSNACFSYEIYPRVLFTLALFLDHSKLS